MKKFTGGKSGDEGIGFVPKWTHFFRLQYLSDSFTAKHSRDNLKKQETQANGILLKEPIVIGTADDSEMSFEHSDASFQDDASDFLCYMLILNYDQIKRIKFLIFDVLEPNLFCACIIENVTTTDDAFGVSSVYNSDPASWNIISPAMIEHFIHNPPKQNMELLSETEKIISGSKRLLTENNFYRRKKNNEKVSREWLHLP